jgi:hydrogenase maturation protease
MLVRIVGIGQRAAGDDGAGPAVLDRLRADGLCGPDVKLCEAAEPSALIPLLLGARRVIVVDAALAAGAPGEVLVVRPEDIETRPLSSVSTHGMSVGQAIALARVLFPDAVCADIHVVAIAAERPCGLSYGLSERVAAAIPAATRAVLALAEAAIGKDRIKHKEQKDHA